MRHVRIDSGAHLSKTRGMRLVRDLCVTHDKHRRLAHNVLECKQHHTDSPILTKGVFNVDVS